MKLDPNGVAIVIVIVIGEDVPAGLPDIVLIDSRVCATSASSTSAPTASRELIVRSARDVGAHGMPPVQALATSRNDTAPVYGQAQTGLAHQLQA